VYVASKQDHASTLTPRVAAEAFEVVAIIVPNPEFNPDVSSAMIVNSSIGFMYETPQITTLSSNNPDKWDKIQGLIYVPGFPANSACFNETRQYVPENATRLVDFRGSNYPLVALAPWTTNYCTQDYLAQMRTDDAQAVVCFS